MGNLKDQLQKARLLSKKEARRLAHSERVQRKEKGRQQLEDEQAERRAELESLIDDERQETRQTQAELERRRQDEAEEAACRAILAREARPAGPGSVKWYFQTPSGYLAWLDVSSQQLHQLLNGTLSVVRTGPEGSHNYQLLATEHSRRIAQHFGDRIVHGPAGVS